MRLLLVLILAALCAAQPPDPQQQKKALIAIEEEWLKAGDAAALERILAADFVHPLPQGIFLDKKEQVDWVRHHPPEPHRNARFDRLQVRIYKDVGIVNGIVIAEDSGGKEQKTVFTDVFAFRNGRWQAINAQENAVEPSRR